MAASDHIQLKMFMSPREIGGFVDEYADFGRNPGGLPHESFRELGAMRHHLKSNNLSDSGMDESIRTEGVKKPVDIAHSPLGTVMINGHHRTLSQSRSDPDRLMPVVHTSYGDNQYWGKDSQGMRREGLVYNTFGMHKTQKEDPTGDQR